MAQLDLRRAPVKAAPATVNGTEVDSHLRVTRWSNSGNSFTVSGTYTPPNTSISEVFVRRKDRKPVSIQAVQVNSNGGNWSASLDRRLQKGTYQIVVIGGEVGTLTRTIQVTPGGTFVATKPAFDVTC